MAAVLRILGWRAEGLRCPDHEIRCADSEGNPYPVSLIQMPNGTGKTTTLTLLRAALSGSLVKQGWNQHQISEFRKKNSDVQDGIFEVRLLLNDRRATIVLAFNFESSRVSYKTTYGLGHRDGFHPPSEFRRFMNENFVNFYVFDGELAQHLLDKEHTDAQIVVENLFQMNVFHAMARKVGEHWDNKTQNAGASEKRGLSRRRNRLGTLRARLTELKKRQFGLIEQRKELVGLLGQKRDTYQQQIDKEKERSKSLSTANTNVETLNGKVREEAMDVLESMRDPHALSSSFAKWMLELKDGLDRVKLPESAAREFFEDLSKEDECVCGRPINAKVAETIRERANQYLGTEDVSLLNSMKTAIKDVVGSSPEDKEKRLNLQIENLSTVMAEARDAKNDLDQLSLEAELSDPAIKDASQDIESLLEQIRVIDEQLEKFESKDQTLSDDKTFGIEILEKRIKDAESKLADITRTLNEKEKRDILTSIIESAHEKARKGITTDLCDQANSRISKLMPYNSVSIDRIGKNLILEGQEGGSTGETLSIAYAFLATLFHRGEHQLPFVVDSPAGPIDLAVRPKIGELIPNLSGQFIAFTISSERPRFVAPLKQASKSEVHFVTLFRRGSKDLEQLALQNEDVSETVDGLSVIGEDFFNEFQLEEEETN